MTAILATILAKFAPWIGMAVSIAAAYFGIKRSAKHAAIAEAQSDVAVAAAKVTVDAQKQVTKHVQAISENTKTVQNSINLAPDSDVIDELRKNWTRSD